MEAGKGKGEMGTSVIESTIQIKFLKKFYLAVRKYAQVIHEQILSNTISSLVLFPWHHIYSYARHWLGAKGTKTKTVSKISTFAREFQPISPCRKCVFFSISLCMYAKQERLEMQKAQSVLHNFVESSKVPYVKNIIQVL